MTVIGKFFPFSVLIFMEIVKSHTFYQSYSWFGVKCWLCRALSFPDKLHIRSLSTVKFTPYVNIILDLHESLTVLLFCETSNDVYSTNQVITTLN